MTAEKVLESQGFWRSSWRRFCSYRLGVAGLVIVLALLFMAFFAPALANEQPLVCRYEGRLFFPAIVDTIHNVPLTELVIRKDRPFRLASFDFKSEFRPERGDWALWTPIPFGPREIISEPLLGPSRRHWLGTDQSGRDVLARVVHGAGVSMRVGFISMGIAVAIGLVLGSIAGYAGKWPTS